MALIVKPIITEKANGLTEKLGRYSFVVDKTANKIQIKTAIEKNYGVTVQAVNTIRYAAKLKRNKKTWQMDGKTSAFKKAIITLKDGDVIDIYGNI